MAKSWLQLVVDDVDGLPQTLAEVAPEQLRSGSIRIAVWSYVWLSRAHYLLGNWDEAADAAERAVALLEETEHEWLRPLARWVAVAVVGGRGDWAAAQEHVAAGVRSDQRLRADDRGLRARRRRPGLDPRRSPGGADGPRAGAGHPGAADRASTSPDSGHGNTSTATR